MQDSSLVSRAGYHDSHINRIIQHFTRHIFAKNDQVLLMKSFTTLYA